MAGLPPALTPELREALLGCSWPGNVRELENLIRRYLVMRDAGSSLEDLKRRRLIAAPKLPEGPVAGPVPSRLLEPNAEAGTLDAVDSAHRAADSEVIQRAFEAAQWNRKRAALLGVDYKALLYRMKNLGSGSGTETKASSASVR